MAMEVRTLLDREGQMMDVGFDVTGRLQINRDAANDPQHGAAHDHSIGRNRAGYLALVADDYFHALDIALDVAIDLQRTLADYLQALTYDGEVVTDYRLRERFR
jgi:hypothetical protein